MNEQQLAAAAMQFLRRTQLSGEEAPTLLAVMQWLQSVAVAPQQGPDVPDAPAPKPSRARKK